MAYEALAWPNEPTGTDGNDGPTAYYALGPQFHLLDAQPCAGVRWRVPDNAPNPGALPITIALWDAVTNGQLAVKAITPTPGGFQDFLWDTPVALAAAPAEYVVSVYTHHYTFSPPTPSSGWLVASPSGNIRHEGSRLTGPRPDAPTSLAGWGAFNTWYYVSPLVETPGGGVEVLGVLPAGTLPGGVAATFAAAGLLTVGPASTLPGGSTVALRRGDVLAALPAGTLPGPGRATFTEVDPGAGTSSPNPALLTVSRDRVELTTSQPHVLTTGAL